MDVRHQKWICILQEIRDGKDGKDNMGPEGAIVEHWQCGLNIEVPVVPKEAPIVEQVDGGNWVWARVGQGDRTDEDAVARI